MFIIILYKIQHFHWKKPFSLVANKAFSSGCGDDREGWKTLIMSIYKYFLGMGGVNQAVPLSLPIRL